MCSSMWKTCSLQLSHIGGRSELEVCAAVSGACVELREASICPGHGKQMLRTYLLAGCLTVWDWSRRVWAGAPGAEKLALESRLCCLQHCCAIGYLWPCLWAEGALQFDSITDLWTQEMILGDLSKSRMTGGPCQRKKTLD